MMNTGQPVPKVEIETVVIGPDGKVKSRDAVVDEHPRRPDGNIHE